MTRVRRPRLPLVGGALVALLALALLPGCEPGDTIPIVESAEVQADQTTIRIKWKAVTQAVDSYEIYFRKLGDTAWKWSSTTDVGPDHRSWVPVIPGATNYSRDFRALDITAGETYQVAVRSVTGTSGSDLEHSAAKVQVTTRSPAPTATAPDDTSITMTWPAATYTPFLRWDFYLSAGTTSTPAFHSSSTTAGLTSKTFTGLTGGTTYTVGVRAVQSTGDGTNGLVTSAIRTTTARTWTKTFSDEFTGTSLDTSKWNVVTGGISNYYSCMRQENVSVTGGALRLNARNENATCNGGQSIPYTGSYIQTRATGSNPDRFNQAYGKWVFSARTPEGPGLWPSIWLTNTGGAGQGELDVLEAVGVHPTRFTSTIHYYPNGTPHWKSGHNALTANPVIDLTSGFHTYVLEWTPCRIAVSIDGVLQKEWTSWFPGNLITPDPFDQNGPMNIRLDNKVGVRDSQGNPQPAMVPENVPGPFTGDKVFELDYVRVYSQPSYALPAGCPNA